MTVVCFDIALVDVGTIEAQIYSIITPKVLATHYSNAFCGNLQYKNEPKKINDRYAHQCQGLDERGILLH